MQDANWLKATSLSFGADYAHDGKWKQMTLAASEFLRRFFLHVLPKAFVRIRHFGFLANRFRAPRVSLCRQLLTNLSCTPTVEGMHQYPSINP